MLPERRQSGYVLQRMTPYMCCVRLCAVDGGRSAFRLLSEISGHGAQRIINRLRTMPVCALVSDAAEPSDADAVGHMRRRPEPIPLCGGGFRPGVA